VSYFISEGKDRTRIELEHRRLDRYGARRDEVRGIFDSDIGWQALLDAFLLERRKDEAHDERRSLAHQAVPVSAHGRNSEPQPVLL
jgi:hypothetical protein